MSNTEIKRRGLMLVLSSPSGAGKTTLAKRLLNRDPQIVMSVSATTRPARPGEVEGEDYLFVSHQEFDDMVAKDEFLEHATVFGHRYGTPRAAVEAALSEGRDVLFDIDWQGTQQLSEKAESDVVKIFILPPTWGELEQRLKVRALDPPDVVAGRMSKAADEMSHWPEYDYIIVNRDLAIADRQVNEILASERLRRHRQLGLSEFVKQLVDRQ